MVREALRAFEERIRGKEVQILSDNSTTVAFLNWQGGIGSRTLFSLAQEILKWAEQKFPHSRQFM